MSAYIFERNKDLNFYKNIRESMPKESFELIESCVRIIIRQKIFINSDTNSVRIIGRYTVVQL